MQRPSGLRLHKAPGPWWRLDAERPDDWQWNGFDVARHRFDPPSGRFRVRYAANDPVAAARERFPGRMLTTADRGLALVRLDGAPRALHLTRQATLDALGLDDRASTGRLDPPVAAGSDPLLSTCQAVSDAVWDWWEGTPPPLVHRTRTVPAARSMAFTRTTRWDGIASRPLQEAVGLLVLLVTRHAFTVPDHWLR